MSTTDELPEPIELSIGTLSSATGVPVETLRTWERRYGFPVPVTRTGGSHRRYAAETIDQLRLIARAIHLGHRASAVVGRDLGELRRLVDPRTRDLRERDDATLVPAAELDPHVVARWLGHTRAMDGEALLGDFQRTLAGMPALGFLVSYMGPYLQAMGDAWASGELRVSQEHFASERVREFLSAQWRGLNDGARGTSDAIVLATPPGERHALGLHMAAWVVALTGARVVFLGTDVPMEEVAFATHCHQARGAVLSVAAGYCGDLAAELRALTAHAAGSLRIAVGGAGSRRIGSDQVLNSFLDLSEWATG
ncbi:MAG: hypothetical protein RL033_3770 [Pseudomonadota bacterium]